VRGGLPRAMPRTSVPEDAANNQNLSDEWAAPRPVAGVSCPCATLWSAACGPRTAGTGQWKRSLIRNLIVGWIC